MLNKFRVALFVASLARGQQVAIVDLTVPPKTPEPANSITRSAGGKAYDRPGPSPGTPTVRVRLLRITTYTERGSTKHAIEVLLTNIGSGPQSIPIGTDPNSTLAHGEQNRQYITLTVKTGSSPRDMVASQRAATSSTHPESISLHPGESVLYRLPIPMSDSTGAGAGKPIPEVTVSVQLHRIVVDNGEDWNLQVGDEITSENSLPWR